MDSIEWAAGLFEGEGCITTVKRRDGKRHITLSVRMTDRDVLERFATVVGGKVTGPYKPGPKGIQATWDWHSPLAQAETVLRRLLPYLGVRRHERAAELGVTEWNEGPTKNLHERWAVLDPA